MSSLFRLRSQPLLVLLLMWGAACGMARAQDYTGLVYPLHDIVLSTGVGGVVLSRPVELGRHVRANEVLLVIDDRLQAIEAQRRRVIFEDQSELKAAVERLRILKQLYEDARQVFEKTGSVSRDELLRLEAEYLAAQGRLDQLRAQKKREQLEYQSAEQERQLRHLLAPVAGVVVKIEPDVAEWARPGDPLLQLVDASVCVFRVNVPLAAVSGMRVGQSAPLQIDQGGRALTVQARVTFISPVADPASGLVELRLNFDNPRLQVRPGAKGTLRLGTGSGKS